MDYDDVFSEACDFCREEDWENASLTFIKALPLAPNDEEKGKCCFMSADSILEIVKISGDKELFNMAVASLTKSADYGFKGALDYLKRLGINYTPQKPSSSSGSTPTPATTPKAQPAASGSSGEWGMTSSAPAIPPVSSLPPNFTGMAEEHIFGNGDIYKGEWYNGRPEGRGKKIFADGRVYEGDFWILFEGKGKMTYPNGRVEEGEWKDGKFVGGSSSGSGGGGFTGRKKVTFDNGDVYEGDFVDGKFHGKGKMTSSDGNVFEGNFVNGKPE